jgi:hypothetical protein
MECAGVREPWGDPDAEHPSSDQPPWPHPVRVAQLDLEGVMYPHEH